MNDDDIATDPADETQPPQPLELPEQAKENLEEVAPLPAPVPDPGPLLTR